MILLEAPFPAIAQRTTLPSPDFSDSISLVTAVQLHRSMNGVKRTYVKRTGSRRKYNFKMSVTRLKSLEFIDFIKRYAGVQWRLTNYNGEKIVGFLLTNPISFATPGRGYFNSQYNTTGNEGSDDTVTFDFEFTGFVQP